MGLTILGRTAWSWLIVLAIIAIAEMIIGEHHPWWVYCVIGGVVAVVIPADHRDIVRRDG